MLNHSIELRELEKENNKLKEKLNELFPFNEFYIRSMIDDALLLGRTDFKSKKWSDSFKEILK